MHEVDAQWGASLRPPIEASVEMLLHLEAIWLLRPRYCRFVDLKLWDELEDILTPDIEVFSNNDVGMPPPEVPVANSPLPPLPREVVAFGGAAADELTGFVGQSRGVD
jgi:hypothetical protein